MHDLTEQLRRAQKIGALGRLAGGVAHDFNNLLQVIGGYADALGADQLDPATRRRLLRTIRGATDRAASLTRQLLAFGRRQVLVPEVVDLNVTVRSMERMMSRVIGEHIQFVSVLAPDLATVTVDPGQIEQVLLNLVLNARDAMPTGGLLELATANQRRAVAWSTPSLPVTVPDGAWVLVTVRDTGSGMDADTAAQAFEPFFTTKDATHGSGLGLSMVYGIVKQSGGYTWIDSTPGAGTTVHLLLPARAAAAPAGARRADRARSTPPAAPRGGILLVEDDPEVRALFSTFLRQAGHDVVEAADGSDAVEAFNARQADIDVLVTDVVMPHIGGPALAATLRARNPRLKVIFVSGHAEQLELTPGTPDEMAYLQKPVTRLALLRQVAALLVPGTESAPPLP
ncbi:MAG: ATP-binding protein [Acidobacteriota bacterium]